MSRENILQQLRQAGNAYPQDQFPDTALSTLVRLSEPFPLTAFRVAGRVQFVRDIGKCIFFRIVEGQDSFQLFISKKDVSAEVYEHARLIQSGDIILATGTLFRTQRGEATLNLAMVQILTKCLATPPEKFHGLQDQELRQRQRYVDLLSNEDVRRRFIQRSQILQNVRAYLLGLEFLEVETPILQALATGAAARPFSTHHNSLNQELFLRIAPELYLKRLVVGGFPRVFELNRNFRNEGLSTRHNPEFTMLEFYEAYTNYQALMGRLQELLQTVVVRTHGRYQVPFQGQQIDFASFTTLTMEEAVARYSAYSGSLAAVEDLRAYGARYGEVTNLSHGELLTLIFEHEVETQLIQPHFITHYPLEVSPLARAAEAVSPAGIAVAERFELFIAGMEVANGFNELNDAADQLARFQRQAELAAAGREETHPVDLDYINALSYGLPPTAGAGLGIDRLVMILLDQASIREVLLFPHLRSEEA